ncbi:MAG TPA: IclR family transcriptional regulator [Verrucomicrobiae bacterium]|nr:IclR family transcriptional regulator [Verrucomicrobiae bacterium]
MPLSAVNKHRREPRETPSIQSLDRGLMILEAVGKSSEPVSLGPLAAMLGIDRSSAFRLANTLKRRGYLANASIGRDYVLGASVWRLSHQYDWSKMLVTVAHEHLKTLATETNETAHLAVREGKKALFIDHVTGSHVIAISGQTGEFVPLHCTSHGKALLSDFEEGDLARLLGKKPLVRYTKNTISSIRALARECETIRAQDFAADNSEYLDGVCCIAAPIRIREGAVIASIGISVPAARLAKDQKKKYTERVVAAAAEIGQTIASLDE